MAPTEDPGRGRVTARAAQPSGDGYLCPQRRQTIAGQRRSADMPGRQTKQSPGVPSYPRGDPVSAGRGGSAAVRPIFSCPGRLVFEPGDRQGDHLENAKARRLVPSHGCPMNPERLTEP